jgi:hypothetical protein
MVALGGFELLDGRRQIPDVGLRAFEFGDQSVAVGLTSFQLVTKSRYGGFLLRELRPKLLNVFEQTRPFMPD